MDEDDGDEMPFDGEFEAEASDRHQEQDEQEAIFINEIFSRFKSDPDQDFISVDRLIHVLQALGRNPSFHDAEQRVTELETIGKFELTLEDIIQILNEPWTLDNIDRDSLRQAFERFDPEKEGQIDVENFRTIMATLGEPLTEDELDDLIQLGLNEEQTKINIDYLLDQLLGSNI